MKTVATTTPTLTPTTAYQPFSTLAPAPVVVEAGASVASDALVDAVDCALVVDTVNSAVLASGDVVDSALVGDAEDETTLASGPCVMLEDSMLVDAVAPLASPTYASDDELSTLVICVGVDIGVTETDCMLTTSVNVELIELESETEQSA